MTPSPYAIIAHPADFRIYRDIPLFGTCCRLDIDTVRSQDIENRYAVVVLDWGSAVEKGLLLLRTLKSDHPRTPIVVVSRIESAQIVKQTYRLGAREFFCHPFPLEELTETIESLSWLFIETAERRTPLTIHSATTATCTNLPVSETLPSAIPTSLRHAIEYIERECTRDITLDEIAAAAGLSKFHFSRLFVKYLGLTPMSFVAVSRIRRAAQLILETPESISTIAQETGFNSQSAFIAHFKSVTGLTPSEFRKKSALH